MTLVLMSYEKMKDLLIRFLAFFLGIFCCSITPLEMSPWPHHVAPTWRYHIIFVAIVCGFFMNLRTEKAFCKQDDEDNFRRVKTLSYVILAVIGFILWPILSHI